MNDDNEVPPPVNPAREGWSVHHDEGFIEHVGPIWELRGPDAMRYGFVADPKHANLLGVVQGGMLMTFADRALGLAAWNAAGKPCVTVQFEMQFLAPTRIGEFVELRPEVIRRTASLVFLRGVLLANSRAVAAASGIWKVLAQGHSASGRITSYSAALASKPTPGMSGNPT